MRSLKSGMGRRGVFTERKPAQAIPSGDPKLTEQIYKNIRVLKGIPANEIIPAMQFVTASWESNAVLSRRKHFDHADRKPKQIAVNTLEVL